MPFFFGQNLLIIQRDTPFLKRSVPFFFAAGSLLKCFVCEEEEEA